MDKSEARLRCVELAHRLASAQALRDPQEVVAIARKLCDYVLGTSDADSAHDTREVPAAQHTRHAAGTDPKRTTLTRPVDSRKDGTK